MIKVFLRPHHRRRRPARLLSSLAVLSSLALLCGLLALAPSLARAPAENTSHESPTPNLNLHQWGAVTLFHGLPSDRVRAIAQDADGTMWFGTDAGLARYDGRRTQTVVEAGLAARRVLALRSDPRGRLWVGTDAGAFVRTAGGEFARLDATEGKTITAIAVSEADAREAETRVVLATNAGVVFDCRARDDLSLDVRAIEDRLLVGVDTRSPLELTSAILEGETILLGTRGRGLLAIEGGVVREVLSRPRAFFVETIERDRTGTLWFGAQTTSGDSGLYEGANNLARPQKIFAGSTGTVTALRADERGELFVGTDGEGVLRYRGRTRLERFTFEGTAGGLRSDRIYSIFIDREGVAWFGTDRGVCRYDPRGLRNESLAAEAQSNFVRTLFQASDGRLLAGTNRGLFVRDAAPAVDATTPATWRSLAPFSDKTVYAVANERDGLLLVGTSSGLYTDPPPKAEPRKSKQPAPSDDSTAKTRTATRTSAPVEAAKESQKESQPANPRRPRPSKAAERANANRGAKGAPPERRGARAGSGKETSAERVDEEERRAVADEAESRREEKPAGEAVVAGSVRAISHFQKATYLASFGRGLERLERTAEGRLRSVLVWPADNAGDPRLREVVSLHADEEGGRLWLGTASAGVFFFDGAEVRTEQVFAPLDASAVRAISGSIRRALWLATDHGLYLFRAGHLRDVAPNVDARSVLDITQAASEPKDEQQPAAGKQSPSADERTAQSAAAETSSAATSSAATSSASSPQVQAWCATAGSGLLKVSVDDVFGVIIARLDAEQGLPSQNVFAMLPSGEGRASGGEKSVGEREKSAGEREKSAGESEKSNGHAAAQPPALLIATSRGISRYEPGATPPALRATRVTGARAYSAGELRDGLRLEYPQNSLVLDVAATSSRTFPEQFQYAFLLYDDQGQVIKRKLAHDSQLQIEDLRPGSYRVEARAYNADLVSSAPLAFRLQVERAPFPWTTAALSVLLALALVALLWGALQNSRLTRAGTALMDANRQLATARLQLANEAETERRRIARDLHDQTLADLRRLLLLTDKLQAEANGNGHAKSPELLSGAAHQGNGHGVALDATALRAEIESISQEIRRICEDLSPSVLENVGFAAALEWALAERVAHLPADCRFAYEFVCADDLDERLGFSAGVEMQLYRIVQEAVSNVCRHAEATRVRMEIAINEGEEFVLTLEDDGRGFDPANKKAHMGRGLANIRARASIIDAEVRWDKRPGAEGRGIVFTLRKPITHR